ncbi:MAG: nitrate/sulfonate/bicarbonate ABC transporter ATP-binding protein [Gammaproteobacteria bacterium]
MKQDLLQVKNLNKIFKNTEGNDNLVLSNINLTLKEGEFLALLGKSGSGKSTLLKIISGLLPPSSGDILLHDHPNLAMVFQQFALLPWLTVLENVELGLEALGLPEKERRAKALQAIDMIGLDGFESAYPKELSGGMRQRVGFARALVVEPAILIMDEPFSALDILTAENLRNDLLELWSAGKTQTKSIICVTHDIEEAILLADRVVIFASDPGRIHAELAIDLPYPRDTQSPEVRKLISRIYNLLTVSERARLAKAKAKIQPQRLSALEQHLEFAYRLPEVSVSELAGLLESMQAHETEGFVDLPTLADELHLDLNNLFPLTEALDMLRFTKISNGNLQYTEAGRKFADAEILERKHLFAKHLLNYIPLAKYIRDTLEIAASHRISEEVFLELLLSNLSEEEAEKVLKVIIDWGRYAEIFAYDFDAGILSLENPE